MTTEEKARFGAVMENMTKLTGLGRLRWMPVTDYLDEYRDTTLERFVMDHHPYVTGNPLNEAESWVCRVGERTYYLLNLNGAFGLYDGGEGYPRPLHGDLGEAEARMLEQLTRTIALQLRPGEGAKAGPAQRKQATETGRGEGGTCPGVS